MGRKYCILTNSGTTALTLALRSLQMPKYSEIMVSPLNCLSVLLAILFADAKPLFIDIKLPGLGIDFEDVKRKLNPRVKALIAIHPFGRPEDVFFLENFARQNGLFLIEDFAAAFGGKIKGKMMGAFGDLSITSFGRCKVLDCGHGGAIFTDNEVLYQRCVKMIDQLPTSKFRESAYQWAYARAYGILGVARRLSLPRRGLCQLLFLMLRPLALTQVAPETASCIGESLEDLDRILAQRLKHAQTLYESVSHQYFEHQGFDALEGTYFRYSILSQPEIREKIVRILASQGTYMSTLYAPTLGELYGSSASVPKAQEVAARIINLVFDRHTSDEEITRLAERLNLAAQSSLRSETS